MKTVSQLPKKEPIFEKSSKLHCCLRSLRQRRAIPRNAWAMKGEQNMMCSECGQEIVFMSNPQGDIWQTKANGYIVCPFFGKRHRPGKPRTLLAKQTIALNLASQQKPANSRPKV